VLSDSDDDGAACGGGDGGGVPTPSRGVRLVDVVDYASSTLGVQFPPGSMAEIQKLHDHSECEPGKMRAALDEAFVGLYQQHPRSEAILTRGRDGVNRKVLGSCPGGGTACTRRLMLWYGYPPSNLEEAGRVPDCSRAVAAAAEEAGMWPVSAATKSGGEINCSIKVAADSVAMASGHAASMKAAAAASCAVGSRTTSLAQMPPVGDAWYANPQTAARSDGQQNMEPDTRRGTMPAAAAQRTAITARRVAGDEGATIVAFGRRTDTLVHGSGNGIDLNQARFPCWRCAAPRSSRLPSATWSPEPPQPWRRRGAWAA
jgi:hypothetical protein